MSGIQITPGVILLAVGIAFLVVAVVLSIIAAAMKGKKKQVIDARMREKY